jgi:hypothetical protein
MKNTRFWIPVISGALLTPLCLYLIGASASGTAVSGHAGAGMGAMLLFFPLPAVLKMLFSGASPNNAFLALLIPRLGFAAMVLQFPLYGFISSYAHLKRRSWLRLCVGAIWLHLIVIIGCVVVFFMQA